MGVSAMGPPDVATRGPQGSAGGAGLGRAWEGGARDPAQQPCPDAVAQAPEGLGLVHVQGRAADAPLLQRLGQRLLVHQAAPRRVHQEGPLSHL